MLPVFRTLSIKTRLIAAVSFLVIAIVAAITYVVLAFFEGKTKELIATQQFMTVSLLANEIDDKLTTAHSEVISLSKLIKAEYLSDSDAAQELMDRYLLLNATFSNALVLLDDKGALIAETPMQSKERRGQVFGFREYFATTLATGKPYIGQPYLSSRHQHPVITLTAPVFDSEGKVIAVFGGSIDLLTDNVLSRLLSMRSGNTDYFYLVTCDRNLILHPDQSRILKKDIPVGSNTLYERAIEGFEGTGETINTRGIDCITSFKRLKTKDWIVGANYPKAQAYAPIYQARNTLVLVLAATLVLVTIIVWYWMNSLTRPLLDFTRHVETISEKKGEERFLPTASSDEIGRLTHAFNRMVVELDAQQQALLENEQKFRRIVDTSNEGIWIVDDDGRVTFVNARMADMLGCRMEELLGRRAADFVFEADLPDHSARLEKRRQGLVEQYERRWRRRDGKALWTIVSATPIFDTEQHFRGAFAMITDITELKLAEEKLQRLAEAVNQTSEAVVITGRDGAIEYVNPSFVQITGYSQEDVIGQNPRFLRGDKRDETVYESICRTITAGSRWSGRTVNRRKDGTLYTEACSITPVKNQLGEIERFVSVKRDITKEVEMEERLRQTERLESVGHLAAGVAHDLNNLLSPILGYAELLLRKLDPSAEFHRMVQVIQQSAERSRELVHQLLAFGRKQIFEIKTLDLCRVVNSLEKLLRRTIRENITLEISVSPLGCKVSADSGQIGQILMNLAVNAQDAMPEGGTLLIEVFPARLDEGYCLEHADAIPGDYVMLAVSDTGCGMDLETQRQIFEPFFTTKKDLGTGLGLATVYGIVKQHGGNIWVYSEPGKGTSFKIYLPTAKEESEGEGMQAPTIKTLHGSETILVVEDNGSVRDLACLILEEHGYKVLAAANGLKAMQLVAAHKGPIHLLLTDVIMPDMNGKALFEQLRRSHPELRVLFMSGYTDSIIAQQGVLAEGVNFIQKPFAVKALAEKVRQVLGG
jgi:two-component system, cell cycle sensor histidine kinase and response regulator CckA